MKMLPVDLAGTLILLLFMIGCSFFSNGTESVQAQSVELGESFALEEGESIDLREVDAILRFVEEQSDNRCPIGVDCVWEGEATILLALDRSGRDSVIFEMTGYVGPEGTDAVMQDVAGFRFTLTRLDPYPEEGEKHDGPTTATLMVERM